jgi:hypothetical protein
VRSWVPVCVGALGEGGEGQKERVRGREISGVHRFCLCLCIVPASNFCARGVVEHCMCVDRLVRECATCLASVGLSKASNHLSMSAHLALNLPSLDYQLSPTPPQYTVHVRVHSLCGADITRTRDVYMHAVQW